MALSIAQPRAAPALVVGAGLAALAIAYASQVWGGLPPCVLCIYQRYAHAMAVLFGLAALAMARRPERRRLFLALAGLSFLGGAAIAFFHVGVEQLWWRGTDGCHAPALDPSLSKAELRARMLNSSFVACDQVPWSFLGLSIAGYNAILSLALAGLSLAASHRVAGRGSGPVSAKRPIL